MFPNYLEEVLSDKRNRIVLLVLVVFVFFAAISAYTTVLGWDEGSYLMNAQYFIGEGENVAFEWPFFTPGLVAAAWLITGESVIVGRFISILFGGTALVAFYMICKDRFDSPIYPFGLLALAPLFVFWSSQIMTEAAAFLFLFLSLYFLERKRPLVAGVLMGITASIRYVFVIFGLAFLVSYIVRKDRETWKYVVGALLGAIPFFIYSHVWHGGVFSIVIDYISSDAPWSGFLSQFVTDNTKKFFILYIPLLPAVVLGWKRSPVVDKLSVLMYSVFLVLFVGVSYYRYWLPVMPFMVMIAYRGLDKRKFVALGLVFVAISGFVVYDYAQERTLCRDELYEAHEFLMGHEGAVVSTVHWTITGYRVDREVYAPWQDYESFKEYNVTHILTDGGLDYPVEAHYPNCGYRVYRLQEL